MARPWTNQTDYLVIVNYYDVDVAWANKLTLSFIIYKKDTPTNEPFNARNKAKSESKLCKFISDFYDELPKT